MASDQPLTAELSLYADAEDNQRLTITLADVLPANWQLHIDFLHDAETCNGTTLECRIGSHMVLSNNAGAGVITLAGREGKGPLLRRVSDLPAGFYIEDLADGSIYVVPVSCDTELTRYLAEPPCETNSLSNSNANLDTKSKSYSDGHLDGCSDEQPNQHPDDRANDDSTDYCKDSLLDACSDYPQAELADLPIVPRPASVTLLDSKVCLDRVNGGSPPELAHSAFDWLNRQDLLTDASEKPHIEWRIDKTESSESYALTISSEGILISAGDAAGFFYGAVSLQQCMVAQQATLCCRITDAPCFSYRGLLLDCARHFHSTATIMRVLDSMAALKLNRFHWHLTDDEAWRLEIPGYPELTDVGAWRGHGLPLCSQYGSGPDAYGGFYSTEDVRMIVQYAAARHIEVVPEIDIPGHCRAALRSLPSLLVEPSDASVFKSVQHYTDNVLNPALPGTQQFLATVMTEVARLFPSSLVHIGGDEVPEGAWLKSPAYAAMSRKTGLSDPSAIHALMLSNTESMLAALGKGMAVWEEAAATQGISAETTVFAWTGSATDESLKEGQQVVVCTAPYLYHDLAWSDARNEPGLYWAGTAGLKQCFEFEPEVTPSVIGIQAQVWSELIATPEALDHRMFPRLLASAETAWSAGGGDWADFLARARAHSAYLRTRGHQVRDF